MSNQLLWGFKTGEDGKREQYRRAWLCIYTPILMWDRIGGERTNWQMYIEIQRNLL